MNTTTNKDKPGSSPYRFMIQAFNANAKKLLPKQLEGARLFDKLAILFNLMKNSVFIRNFQP